MAFIGKPAFVVLLWNKKLGFFYSFKIIETDPRWRLAGLQPHELFRWRQDVLASHLRSQLQCVFHWPRKQLRNSHMSPGKNWFVVIINLFSKLHFRCDLLVQFLVLPMLLMKTELSVQKILDYLKLWTYSKMKP